MSVKAYRIGPDLFRRTMEFLRERNELYYLYYLLMHFSGVRIEHVVKVVEGWSPREEVYTDSMGE